MTSERFNKEYKKLNSSQRQAVDAIDGPVMVVAGPGTGKTQILTIRIANILLKTDTQADDVLCLTFTNSGVRAMRDRLFRLIGRDALKVSIQTFHSFALALIEEFYQILDLPKPPKILDDKGAVILVDELLESRDWVYLRPRGGGEHNFKDLKTLCSLLTRERVTAAGFRQMVEEEIKDLETSPENLSSRGISKGQLKKEVSDKIARLERTKEVADFYEFYQVAKRKRHLADYDDILEFLVRLVGESQEVRDSLRERFLYILVDEHQDSSGIQNEFLRRVWASVEKPNIFVVGDDRQLIYEFGGANLEHFKSFQDDFPGTQTISLIENYRSTQNILDLAETLLESSLVPIKLKSQNKHQESVWLVETRFPRDEVLFAGLALKEKIDNGVKPEECAILVPKNSQARTAIEILVNFGLPVATGNRLSLFSLPETKTFLNILRILIEPDDRAVIAALILDPVFTLPYLEAHSFVRQQGRALSLESFARAEGRLGKIGQKILDLCQEEGRQNLYQLIQEIGQKIFFDQSPAAEVLLRQVEIVRTLLHLVIARLEESPQTSLSELVGFLNRLESYGEDIPVALFDNSQGIKVITLHGSKGLEFDHVLILHLNERSLMSGRVGGFTLPKPLADRLKSKDQLTARRELYVAVTRARRSLALTYALEGHTGGEQELARIIAELPEDLLVKISSEEAEKQLLSGGPEKLVIGSNTPKENSLEQLVALVRANYFEQKIAVTHLNNFFSCPWKWYFRDFLRLPEPQHESLLFGSLAHVGLEVLIGDRKVGDKQLLEKFNEKLDQLHVYDSRTRGRFLSDVQKLVANFRKRHLGEIGLDLRMEEKITYRDPSWPEIEITGKIDLLEIRDEQTVRVTDFKTGKAKTAREIEKLNEEGRLSDNLRQLAMYTYLLAGKNKKVDWVQLLFVEAPVGHLDLYRTVISPEHIELLRRDLAEFNKSLADGDWIGRPCRNNRLGQDCYYCQLGEKM